MLKNMRSRIIALTHKTHGFGLRMEVLIFNILAKKQQIELKDDELWNGYFGVASSKNKCGGLGFWLTLKICISLSLVEMKWMLG